MRIRQIELVGFKSFREPTRVALAAGINAVVGPNGCGKSNVSDAIRWALGEQSVRNLRAHDMEDVIFGGNARSAPLNLAEVTLTFEQEGEEATDFAGEAEGLAAHVARQHEFTITRRIFRSGESQYLINQAPARLRDITELFLGSGVGPKAYAMIEQGRVGQIVKAKPEEMRLFLEEAAGTTRFRSRKIAAERKLERTSENLARVNDVMREIDRQLATLRRQAKRAEEYRQFVSELQATEVALAATRWRILSREQEAAREEMAHARSGEAASLEALASAESLRSTAVDNEQAAAREIEARFAAVAEVSGAAVRATERHAAAREALLTIEARLGRSVEEISGLEAEAEGGRRSLQESAARLAEGKASEAREASALEAVEAQVEAVIPAFEVVRAEQVAAVAGLEEARRQLARHGAGRAACATRLHGLREERERIQVRLRERESEIGAAESRLAEGEAGHGSSRAAHERLEHSRKEATGELRAREGELRRLDENLTAVREVMVHRRGRLEGLRERERALDGYADGIAVAMAHDPAPRGLVLDGLVIPPELEPAVASVLGDAIGGAVVRTAEEGAKIADHLRRTGAGRVTLVPADAVSTAGGVLPSASGTPMNQLVGAAPGSEAVRNALFEGVMLVADIAAAVRAVRAGESGSQWVTRAGDVVDHHGVVTGGRVPETADLLQRRREVGELEAQIAEDEVRQTAVERRLGEVRHECTVLGADLRRLDAEAHAATLARVAAEHALETARRDLSAARARGTEAREEYAACEGSIEVAATGLAEAESSVRASSGVEAEALARAESAETLLVARRAEVDDARSRREARREALSSAREFLSRAVADHGQREHEIAIAAMRRRSIDDEVERLAQQRAATVSQVASLEEELIRRRLELAEREAEVEAARESARASQVELRDVDVAVSLSRGTLDEARRLCQRIELRLAQQEAQIESLLVFAREQHGIDPAEAQVPEGFDEAGATSRIKALKERIEKLGDVNVAAIADAQELEERFAFLDGQRRDLEASIEDLRQTIGELSRTTRARYRDTFDLANQKFQEFFAELFRGGRAALKLTDPNNLMETGVEMEAQPPGKTVRALEQLSGGEQALTAISFLMALFSLRATPFCVLDEVDAPLDEANLGRFNAMIARMSHRTQFIVITHKQPTMESANCLFGVTMAEAGVSQLVSVALPERDEELGEARGAGMALAASA